MENFEISKQMCSAHMTS